MCTAISDGTLFGRTLDLERSYGESVVLTPRRFPLPFLRENTVFAHAALVGCAHLSHGVPLYYDAQNEWGLAMAALSFPAYAVYFPPQEEKRNLASFELIPYLLGACHTVKEAREQLKSIHLTADGFSADLPPTPLHWLVADRREAVVVESVKEGLRVYENPFGVLTNAPEFPFHTTLCASLMHVGATPPENRLCPEIGLHHYSRGMGGVGLPGDLSSPSRFLRAVFAREHTSKEASPDAAVSRFFHLMDFVSQPRGGALTEEEKPVETVYTSCMDLGSGEYFFTTYASRRIRRVSLREHSLDSERIVSYQMNEEEQFFAPPKS